MGTEAQQQNKRRWGLIVGIGGGAALVIVALVTLAVYAQFLRTHHNTFYPGIMIADREVGGRTVLDVIDEFEQEVAEVELLGILVEYPEAQTGSDEEDVETKLRLESVLTPTDSSGNERVIYDIDMQEAIDTAYNIGRTGSRWQQFKEQISALWYGRHLHLNYMVDDAFIETILRERFAQFESPATNANITIADDLSPQVVAEQSGMSFDYQDMVKLVADRVRSLDTSTIQIVLMLDEPEVTTADVEKNLSTVESYIAAGPLTIAHEEDSWNFDESVYADILSFTDGVPTVDVAGVAGALAAVAEEVEEEPTEARWQVDKDEGGALVGLSQLVEAESGHAIDYEAVAASVQEWLDSPTEEPIALTVIEELPQFTPDNVEDLGITDLLGTGHSNMAGSPLNRQGNIQRGVDLLNGVLIAPDEDFSLVQALRPFTLDNGYLPELVIKGTETVPEIGGGLCQIGTTTFRGALESGLEIVERRNHSYAVDYYADDRNGLPGTDATIYDSKPDFVFKNDTGNYILLQTRREGNDLYFDYWGTSDGREATFSEPIAYNWIAPLPLKEIETDSLAPGQRKCTESAHSGVTAQFTYTIDYGDGRTHEEDFVSVYKPWQAVCLVGKEDEPAPAEEAPVEEEPVEEKAPEESATEEKTEKKNPKKKKKS